MSAYQPKTGAKCGCRRGVQRDNCPRCEGTGMVIDFKAIREKASQPAAPVGGAHFTPGPWYAANMGNDFQGLVVEEQTGKNIAVAYDKRDVHILAAAPAMYAVIKDMREAFYVKGTRKALLEVMERSKDVIAQAEGRQG